MTYNKKQLLDPIGSLCRLIALSFKPLNTKIGISDHAIIIQESNYFQWLDRYLNGDNRENISLLYHIVIRVIDWYILPLSDKYVDEAKKELISKLTKEELEDRKMFWGCLEKMCRFLCKAFEKLQTTYYTGPIPTNVVTTIQFYINILNDSLDGTFTSERIPKCILDAENKNFLDYEKIKLLWNGNKFKQITDLYEKCFEKLNSTDKTKETQIQSYLSAINILLDLHDNQFRELICLSNEG
jgi:hypothetical protein